MTLQERKTKHQEPDLSILASKLDTITSRLDVIDNKMNRMQERIFSLTRSEPLKSNNPSRDTYQQREWQHENYEQQRKPAKPAQTAAEKELEDLERQLRELQRTAELLQDAENGKMDETKARELKDRLTSNNYGNEPGYAQRITKKQICYMTFTRILSVAVLWAAFSWGLDYGFDALSVKMFVLSNTHLSLLVQTASLALKPAIIIFLQYRVISMAGATGLMLYAVDFVTDEATKLYLFGRVRSTNCWFTLAVVIGIEVAVYARIVYENMKKNTASLSAQRRLLINIKMAPGFIFMFCIMAIRPTSQYIFLMVIFHLEIPRLIEALWSSFNMAGKLHIRTDLVRTTLQFSSSLALMSYAFLLPRGLPALLIILLGLARIFVQVVESNAILTYLTKAIFNTNPEQAYLSPKRQ